MKRTLISLFLITCAFAALAQPKIVGHRGCRFDGPYENTLASLAFALEAGVDAVEFDVQLTSDDKVLVFHGPTVPGLDADIRRTSFADARKVVLPGGHQMPTLKEWFAGAKAYPDIPLILEIKKQLSAEKEAILVDKVLDEVQKCKVQGRVEYTSFSETACDRILSKQPDAKIIYLASGVYVPSAAWARDKGYKGISYDLNGFLNHPGIAAEAKALGIETTLWLVNDCEVADWAAAHGIDYISSDHPEMHTALRTNTVTTLPLYPTGPSEDNGLSGEEKVREDGFVYNIHEASISLYLPGRCNGKMVVICPGGGYGGLAMMNEGERVARWFNRRGIAACVVRYRLPNGHPSIPLTDVREAFRYCRSHAAEWGVKSIGIIGFSAGGHLAAMVSNLFTDAITRPDFSILFYPVITMEYGVSHRGTRQNLLGIWNYSSRNDQVKALEDVYSMEKRVSASTPATFIALTATDTVVPPENSIRYFTSLQRQGIPVELHIYPDGAHGFGFLRPEGEDPIAAYRLDLDAALERWIKEL